MKQIKIKRPSFIVFTDKDGTLNLKDEELKTIFQRITQMGGMLIPITGRTVGDIKESLQDNGIEMPEILVGDNGANIYSVSKDTFFIRKNLNHEKVLYIVNCFLENGGNKGLIRYTDGKSIFAANSPDIARYYQDSSTANLYEDIYQKIYATKDITKITLAGKKELIKKVEQDAEKLGFWSDMDKTKFPTPEEENYRLDIASKNISKGKAVKAIVTYLKPKYGYICIGNGYNDLSMFKQAIDDGMTAAVMADSDIELIEEVKEYNKDKQGKVAVVPVSSNLANRYILKIAKVFENYIQSQESSINQEKEIKEKQIDDNGGNSETPGSER